MGLPGHASNFGLADRIARVLDLASRNAGVPVDAAPRLPRHRLEWRSVQNAVIVVMSSADGEMQLRDIHAAVEALCGQPVSRSSVKNCVAKGAAGRSARFERVARGRYRLV